MKRDKNLRKKKNLSFIGGPNLTTRKLSPLFIDVTFPLFSKH
jgi:hypothetical protein